MATKAVVAGKKTPSVGSSAKSPFYMKMAPIGVSTQVVPRDPYETKTTPNYI